MHTSAATVAVLPEAEEVDLVIKESDLRIDGLEQAVPAVNLLILPIVQWRITHISSGVVVSQQDEKSQHKTKLQSTQKS